MTPKTTVSAPTKARIFYDRKVRKEGSSLVVAMGKVIPRDWAYVRVTILTKSTDELTVNIKKLLEAEEYAQTQKPNTQHR